MNTCKRIEIVIEQALARRTATLLEELGAPGFTVLHNASGRGDRGRRRADDPTGSDTNCVFLIACEDAALAGRIVDGIRPLLERSGGICLVSDAEMIHH
jgi:nitrogen regulatory protein PII